MAIMKIKQSKEFKRRKAENGRNEDEDKISKEKRVNFHFWYVK